MVWLSAIYIPAFFSFYLFVPPQGIESSLKWHALFMIPSLVVASIGTLVLRNSSTGRVRGAIRASTTGFLVSLLLSCIECAYSVPKGEASVWYAIPFAPIVFFATLSGAVIGTLVATHRS